MKLTTSQYEQLLRPLAPSRVSNRQQAGMTLAYLEAWDVKAHLIRIFGFGGWSADVLSAELVFEDKDEKGRWNVGYKVIMRLTLHTSDSESTTYTEAAVGSATLPQRGDAHDMAVKTAESDALKRAAINLGTQFGLSLYDNGNRNDVVIKTLAEPEGYEKQPEPATVAPEPPDEATIAAVLCATSESELRPLWDAAVEAGTLDLPIDGLDVVTLRNLITNRLGEIRESEA